MTTLYDFMITEAEALVRREAEMDVYHYTREEYAGMLLMFDRIEEGMFVNGLLDRRQSQHLRAIIGPPLARYGQERINRRKAEEEDKKG